MTDGDGLTGRSAAVERTAAFERYAADGALVLGGLAAILLQVADPVVARGVAAHSAFADDPMRRLRHTLTFVYAVLLGTPAQCAKAAGFVDRAHAGVPGARDGDRQLWVAATLVRVGMQLRELLDGPLDDSLAEEVVAASAAFGTVLQLPPDAWPADRAAFEAYWAAAVARLEVTDDARRVAADLLAARAAPWWVRTAMPLAVTVSAGLLPPSVRDAYGFRHRPARFRRTIRLLRAVLAVTPRRLRELPARRLLRTLG